MPYSHRNVEPIQDMCHPTARGGTNALDERGTVAQHGDLATRQPSPRSQSVANLRDLGVATFGATAKWRGVLPLRLHTPDRDLDVAHLKSGRGPNVRAVECHEHRAAFGAADPVRA